MCGFSNLETQAGPAGDTLRKAHRGAGTFRVSHSRARLGEGGVRGYPRARGPRPDGLRPFQLEAGLPSLCTPTSSHKASRNVAPEWSLPAPDRHLQGAPQGPRTGGGSLHPPVGA